MTAVLGGEEVPMYVSEVQIHYIRVLHGTRQATVDAGLGPPATYSSKQVKPANASATATR